MILYKHRIFFKSHIGLTYTLLIFIYCVYLKLLKLYLYSNQLVFILYYFSLSLSDLHEPLSCSIMGVGVPNPEHSLKSNSIYNYGVYCATLSHPLPLCIVFAYVIPPVTQYPVYLLLPPLLPPINHFLLIRLPQTHKVQ